MRFLSRELFRAFTSWIAKVDSLYPNISVNKASANEIIAAKASGLTLKWTRVTINELNHQINQNKPIYQIFSFIAYATLIRLL